MPDAIEILDPGALTTIQDGGRPGWAHLGVPRSGAADLGAHALANRLVGNVDDAAALETTMTGCTFRAMTSLRIAVAGAICDVRVDGRQVPWGSPVPVPAGAVVEVGRASYGLRSHVAFSGGITVEPVLGSRSTDTLSGLGPAPLAHGVRLPVGVGSTKPVDAVATPKARDSVVRIRLGPHDDWFVDATSIDGARFTVGPDSNRIGVRLAGNPIQRRVHDELESAPMVLGAVQVPPSGQPVVLMADHATTGGYPVIGVVTDVSALAQARPGDEVTLRLVW